jgi:hypothetical protein
MYRERRSDYWRRGDCSINRKSTCWELLLFWYLWSRARLPYNTRQALVHLPPPCCFKIFITLYDALGAKPIAAFPSLELFTISWLPALLKGFQLLSPALEKQMFCFKNKRWCFTVDGMFSKIKLDGGSITTMMDSTSEKMYLCQVPDFGFINDKAETGRVTCTRRESRCSVSVWVD